MKIPESINIQVTNNHCIAEPIAEIAIFIHVFAKTKNDYYLGPYFSNNDGLITIKKEEVEYEILATQDSGVMDYSSIEDAFSEVEICTYTQEQIDRMITTRKKVWTRLMKGEDKRWKTMNELLAKLGKCNNKVLVRQKNIKIDLNSRDANYNEKMVIDI